MEKITAGVKFGGTRAGHEACAAIESSNVMEKVSAGVRFRDAGAGHESSAAIGLTKGSLLFCTSCSLKGCCAGSLGSGSF